MGFSGKKSNSSHVEGQIAQISNIFFQAEFYSKNIKIVGASVNCPYPFFKTIDLQRIWKLAQSTACMCVQKYCAQKTKCRTSQRGGRGGIWPL